MIDRELLSFLCNHYIYMWLFFILVSTLAWALVNVLNSVLVHHYHKSPIILSWIQSILSVPLLGLIALKVDVESSWALHLIFVGMSAYIADLWFFHVAHRIDISVLNTAWSILALFLTLVGIFYFGEDWTFLQSIGALLILIGTLWVSIYHKHINLRRTLWLLVILAALYVPYYSFKKIAMNGGENAGPVFFWLLVGRELPSLLFPLASKRTMQLTIQLIRNNPIFPLKALIVVIFYFLAEYAGTLAYQTGSLSLVSVVANSQPFAVIAIAWLFSLILPKYTPKELLSGQSLKVKLASFALVFLGLMLMPPQ